MKNLLFILVIVLLGSCQKENIQPKSMKIVQNKVEYKFITNKVVGGELEIYVGQNLDTTIQLSDLEFSDTIIEFVTYKKFSVTRFYSTQQIVDAQSWLHLALQFSDSTDVFNSNLFNDKMTYFNNNSLFLEPSNKFEENVVEFHNSMWIKLPKNTIQPFVSNS